MKIAVEAWRYLTHSYALCSQALELEWLRMTDVSLYHLEAGLDHLGWQRIGGVMDEADSKRVGAIPPPPANFDGIWYRHFWPPNLDPAPGKALVVFVSCETNLLEKVVLDAYPDIGNAVEIANAWIVTPSQFSKRGLINSGISENRIHVIPHGVDCTIYQPAENATKNAIRQAVGIGDRFAFLNVSAMTPNKGLPHLFWAFYRVLDSYPEVCLVLKGTDALYKSRDRIGSVLGAMPKSVAEKVSANICYVGDALHEEDMAALYSACDVYVSPYLAEAFNMPVLYAAACGTPSIVTRGGPTDEFTDLSFAKYVPSYRCSWVKSHNESISPDSHALAQTMLNVVHDLEWRKLALAAGPKAVNQGFTWSQIAQRHFECFETIQTT